MMRLFPLAWLVVALSLSPAVAGDEALPPGLAFTGLAAGRWQVYYAAEHGALKAIPTATEPRTPALNLAAGRLAYVSAEGSLREITLADEHDTVVLQADAKRTFTQPAYDIPGNRLFVVELHEGASVETDILALAPDRQSTKPVVIQRSAQFEPFHDGRYNLYYSNVHCTLGCGKIIQEIWRFNTVTGEADQLTLTNHIARQPVASADGKSLYFSSDRAGHFHIWRLNLATGQAEPLTRGLVTDTDPAVGKDGAVYFVRRSPGRTELMRWSASGAPRPVALPKAIEDIRDLEIGS